MAQNRLLRRLLVANSATYFLWCETEINDDDDDDNCSGKPE